MNRTTEFVLLPGESFEIQTRVTEDDPVNSFEPQPWSESRSVPFASAVSESFSFTNGPGCFSDDRIDVVVTVGE